VTLKCYLQLDKCIRVTNFFFLFLRDTNSDEDLSRVILLEYVEIPSLEGLLSSPGLALEICYPKICLCSLGCTIQVVYVHSLIREQRKVVTKVLSLRVTNLHP